MADELQAAYAKEDKTVGRRFQPDRGEDQLLILDAHVGGFRAYRSLRGDFSSIPPVGAHRLLVASAIRQGLGMPVISESFSHELWTPLSDPFKHFLLAAAEQVGKSRCEPLYPNVPTREELKALNDEDTRGFVDNMNPDDPIHIPTLKKLGFGDVLSKRKTEHDQRQQAGSYASDWNDVGEELFTAIYSDEVEQSLHLQDVLDLYPLHKRVLSLLEYILLPEVKAHGFDSKGSQLWTNGFLKTAIDQGGSVHNGPLHSHPQQSKLGRLATLETEGNWLLHAADFKAPDRTSTIDLAALLDGIVTRMSSAAEVTGVSVNLQPPTPQEHARQLAALADRSNNKAACMTLYLGKIALMLRNAVEHGTDRVQDDGLLVDTTHYWDQHRAGRRISIWLTETAAQVSWPSTTSLPATLPISANEFLLTPASLHRCLVLLSLVLHAGNSHLGI